MDLDTGDDLTKKVTIIVMENTIILKLMANRNWNVTIEARNGANHTFFSTPISGFVHGLYTARS